MSGDQVQVAPAFSTDPLALSEALSPPSTDEGRHAAVNASENFPAHYCKTKKQRQQRCSWSVRFARWIPCGGWCPVLITLPLVMCCWFSFLEISEAPPPQFCGSSSLSRPSFRYCRTISPSNSLPPSLFHASAFSHLDQLELHGVARGGRRSGNFAGS